MPPPLPKGYLSPNFTLAEFTISQEATRRGLDNTPGPNALANLHRLASCMEEVRLLLWGAPILPSSVYRSDRVNRLVKGAANSAHVFGLACDFTAPRYGTPLQICQALAVNAGLWFFDQLIFEGTWVHLGLSAAGAQPRREVLTAVFRPGKKTTYLKGLLR